MKKSPIRNLYLTTIVTISMAAFSNAQEGTIVINEPTAITKLLELKKSINKDDKNTDRYKIQIYSGSLATAEDRKSEFDMKVGKWHSKLVFESPNYKVWVGSFRSRLEADRALVSVQRKFRDAFIF